jgi:hypothetical protein
LRAKIALILLWLNFAFLWYRTNHITYIHEVTDSLNYLGGLVLIYGAVVAVWVYHNLRIFRKKGPRLGVRDVPFLFIQDSLQRDITSHIDLLHGKDICVTVIGNRKVFVEGSHPDAKSPRPKAG